MGEVGLVAGLDGKDPLGAFGRAKVGRWLRSQTWKKLMASNSNDDACGGEWHDAGGRMTAACAVRVAANGIGGRRPIVAILITAGGTLMLMQVMTKVLTGFTCLMPAISTRHTPGELECQCNNEQLKEALDHGAIITCFV